MVFADADDGLVPHHHVDTKVIHDLVDSKQYNLLLWTACRAPKVAILRNHARTLLCMCLVQNTPVVLPVIGPYSSWHVISPCRSLGLQPQWIYYFCN